MKKLFLCSCLLVLAMCMFTACGSNDDEVDNNTNDGSVVVNDDGSTSNGSRYAPIDDKNFYLDYVKYSIVDAHIEVSGYDKVGFNGKAIIVPAIKLKGVRYEVFTIAKHSFKECSDLQSIVIPNSVTSIESGAFAGCTGLTSITISNNVTSIGNSTFLDCTNLTSITIPNSVTSIEYGAFSNCTSLTSVTFGNCVTNIGECAFAGCNNLANVYCYAEQVPKTNYSFSESHYTNAKLHVHAGFIEEYQNAKEWENFGSIVALKDNDPKPE